MNNFNAPQILYCKFCGKECKSINSLKQHERRCIKNPNKLYVNINDNKVILRPLLSVLKEDIIMIIKLIIF